MSIIEILSEQLRGQWFIPKLNPSLAGTVKDVHEGGDQDSTCIVVVFEEEESGLNGIYCLYDFNEAFTLGRSASVLP